MLAIDRGTLQLGYGATRMDNGGQVLVGSGRAEILGDIPNYTDIQPILQVDEVVA